jgi:hypothetical protein
MPYDFHVPPVPNDAAGYAWFDEMPVVIKVRVFVRGPIGSAVIEAAADGTVLRTL